MRLLFIISFILFTLPAIAESCIGGTTDQGKNGHTYCFSNFSMNWWSAFEWCKSNGRHLATVWEACDSIDNTLSAYCSNIHSLGAKQNGSSPWALWTSISKNANTAYTVSAHHGFVHSSYDFSKTSDYPALCY